MERNPVQADATLATAECQRDISLEMLDILNRNSEMGDSAQALLEVILRKIGVEAAAIRLKEGPDFTYYRQVGFSQDFLAAENHLCSHDENGFLRLGSDGKPLLECTCGLVLEGRTDSANPLFTCRGSAYTNDAQALAAATAWPDPRKNPRDRCIHDGYRSVALIPIRAGHEIVGLLQLNDRRPDRFTSNWIDFLEGITHSFGIALLRKRTEERVQEGMDNLRLAHDSANAGTWVWNLRTNENTWSETLWKLYGLDPLRDKPSFDSWCKVIHPEDRAHVVQKASEASRAGAEINLEWRVCRPDGTERWLMSRGRPVSRGHAGPESYYGVVMDITDRKRAEEERAQFQIQLAEAQKMESIGRLAGGVAHDFNNSMFCVLGAAELALEQLDESAPIRPFLLQIQLAAQQAADLTKQLLAFSRKQVIQPRPTDMDALILAQGKILQRLLGEDIRIELSLDASTSSAVVDPSQLIQVLINLCVNARDAMPGGGKLAIKTAIVRPPAPPCRTSAPGATTSACP